MKSNMSEVRNEDEIKNSCPEESDDTQILHKEDPILLEAFDYINSFPGKDVRGKLIDCFQLWLPIESADVVIEIKVRVYYGSIVP